MALLLTRRVGEEVVVTLPSGERFVVFVKSMQGKQVRLGFDSPPGCVINRGEIQVRVDAGLEAGEEVE